MKKTVKTIISVILMAAWAVMLLKSESFPFIYVLTALAGIASLFMKKDSAGRPHIRDRSSAAGSR